MSDWPKDLPPAEEYFASKVFKGMTDDTLKKVLTKEAYEAFCEWLRGQTCGVNEQGQAVIYAWDWERWIWGVLKTGEMRRAQTREEWD